MRKLFGKTGKHGHIGPRIENGHPSGPDFGIGVPYKQVWEHRRLPGAGANQWAWETLALPMYTPIGAGTRNVRQMRVVGSTGPVMVAVQGITLVSLGGAPVQGDLTGEFITQPLLDMTQAEGAGMIYPAYNTPPNQFQLPSGSTA